MGKFTLYFILFLIFFNCDGLFSQSEDSSFTGNPVKLTEYLTDETGTLSDSQLVFLRNELRSYYDSTTTQIVVYMIKSLNGKSIEQVSFTIAQENKIGTGENNNGVLLLISKNDRKLRIEVGYGLEPVLTDALASQIIRNEITPEFKKGDYYTGIIKGIKAITGAIKGEYKAEEEMPLHFKEKEYGPDKTAIILGIAIPFGIILIIVILGIIAGKKGWHSNSSGTTYYSGGSRSSGYSSSSSSYSSSSSSSSYSSGFSGGGGSFGGGGASGSW